MTLERFAEIFALLAVQLRFTDADETTIRAYYEALKDIEPEFVAMAADTFGRRLNPEGQAWFPKTPEWRGMAQAHELTRTEILRSTLRKRTEPLCQACDDTGWEMRQGRAHRCPCVELRRLEILGRRPMPTLPEAV